MAAYIPKRGDFIWLDFDPQAGREQAGRRPALILSPHIYNSKSGLAFVCPVTNQVKGYPYEVALPSGLKLAGVVLSDHLRSVDWRVRNAVFIAAAPTKLVQVVLSKLQTLFT